MQDRVARLVYIQDRVAKLVFIQSLSVDVCFFCLNLVNDKMAETIRPNIL